MLGGVGPNAVLCKTYSVLLCVLEQPRVDNSSSGPKLGAICPIGLRSVLPQGISISLLKSVAKYYRTIN